MMHSVYSTNDKNQNSETNKTPYFVAIQGSYSSFELALFHAKKVLAHYKAHDKKASAELIPTLDSLLTSCSLSLKDLSFVAADHGPGAFTSLRVIIATVNGIAYASNIPLIGVDGLDALASQVKQNNTSFEGCIALLLNAFNGEFYYGFYKVTNETMTLDAKGYAPLDEVIDSLQSYEQQMPVLCAGNGIELCYEQLQHLSITLIKDHPVASAESIGAHALVLWNEHKGLTDCIEPQYLKTQRFKPKYT